MSEFNSNKNDRLLQKRQELLEQEQESNQLRQLMQAK